MTVRLIKPYNGQAAGTLYSGADEAFLKASGNADDRTDLVTNFETLTDSQRAYNMITLGTNFVDRTVTLTAAQAAGTDPILAANTARRAVIFKAPKDCALALRAGSTAGTINLYAGSSKILSGADCPRSALYVFGLAQGDVLPIEEG